MSITKLNPKKEGHRVRQSTADSSQEYLAFTNAQKKQLTCSNLSRDKFVIKQNVASVFPPNTVTTTQGNNTDSHYFNMPSEDTVTFEKDNCLPRIIPML